MLSNGATKRRLVYLSALVFSPPEGERARSFLLSSALMTAPAPGGELGSFLRSQQLAFKSRESRRSSLFNRVLVRGIRNVLRIR